MRKFLFFIIILGLLVGIAGFWYWQKNPYSKEILKLEILGPESTTLGQEIEYTVKYKNNGNVRLEEPRLIFEFPRNSFLEEGLSGRQEMGPDELGDIYPGEERIFKFKGRLFGKEQSVKTAKAWLTYRPKNLKARYESTTSFSTTIKSVPLTFDFDLPSKVEAGRDFDFSLNYFSNLDYPLVNLGIKVEYPSGFEFLESAPRALGSSEWEISVLNKAEGGRVEIKGKLTGEIKDQKIFKAELGVWQENEFISLKEVTKVLEIAEPLLSVFQQINGEDNYIASFGDVLHYKIFFRNIGEDPFLNLFLIARLEGELFDFDTIKTAGGQFNKGDNSIIWDWRNTPKMRFLDRGEEAFIEFWIDLKEDLEQESFKKKNFVLKNKVLISQLTEEFETKVNSKLVVSQKGYFQDEVFGNSGPIPPQTGQSTTYTIMWQAKNYCNDLKNVKVKAILPQNVRLTGRIFPEQESSKFTFDNQSREIVWRVRDSETMEAGTGVFDSAPNIAFQVALTPDSNQKGSKAQIIGKAVITGEDQWTNRFVEQESPAIDTSLPDDSTISGVQGIVQ